MAYETTCCEIRECARDPYGSQKSLVADRQPRVSPTGSAVQTSLTKHSGCADANRISTYDGIVVHQGCVMDNTSSYPTLKHDRTGDPSQPPHKAKNDSRVVDNVNHLLGITIMTIHITKDLVLINLVKGILGLVANIPINDCAGAPVRPPERFAKASSDPHNQ
ncbi:uncharacterized protein BJ212DRAFT_1304490 [Suillus subaureus]|uniref:Uncharacterized protein n=1 Tax=Suillus subaureus TaxID=48587 RepID=A0A9P7DVJ9_9AGAM|nr:uncharacterized protein BJ212DRAFT_1304490 [Suillus subaureus]KAG1803977.1 hypothetical protein BJ212DRAFT_1304490 [Suillus subaureus]